MTTAYYDEARAAVRSGFCPALFLPGGAHGMLDATMRDGDVSSGTCKGCQGTWLANSGVVMLTQPEPSAEGLILITVQGIKASVKPDDLLWNVDFEWLGWAGSQR